MLKDPTSIGSPFKTHIIEQQKLENGWQDGLSSLLPFEVNISNKKVESALSSLIHLFDEYMTQVWTDSQSMLQSSKQFDSYRNSLSPRDESFSLHILGLQLMKQSLRTRKEFLYIVNEIQNFSDMHHDSSDYTEYDDSATQEEEVEVVDNIYQQDSVSITSSINSLSLSPNYNRPFRLISSPSSPAIGSAWSATKEEENICAHNFKPASNYMIYYAPNAEARHSTLCHLCKQNIALKKSLSADNLNGLINSDSDDDDEDYLEDTDCGVTILNSDCSDDFSEIDQETRMMANKLLIEENDTISSIAAENYYLEKLQKYNLIDDDQYEGSSKIELDSLKSNTSSSLVVLSSSYFSVDEDNDVTKEPESDIQCRGLIHNLQNSTSTYSPPSTSSSVNNSSSIATTNSVLMYTENAPQTMSDTTKNEKKLMSAILPRNQFDQQKRKTTLTPTVTIAPKTTKSRSSSFSLSRALSYNKANLCNFFYTRKKKAKS